MLAHATAYNLCVCAIYANHTMVFSAQCMYKLEEVSILPLPFSACEQNTKL